MPVLRRTPAVLRALLADLPSAWTDASEGPGTWTPCDIVGHLIHGERTDWMPRVEHILLHGDAVVFPVFDREAMFTASKDRSLQKLLDTFAQLRAANLARLRRDPCRRRTSQHRRGTGCLALAMMRHPRFGRTRGRACAWAPGFTSQWSGVYLCSVGEPRPDSTLTPEAVP
ncbi:MAG: DinB family protein [Candidatus Eisenbacteria bacterium]|nr:DinB family protein [Candidatus Eisenbacteria bacterium]